MTSPSITLALEAVDKFIDVAKQLAALPALVLPQHQIAAQDMYKICQRILKANENLSRWLYRFLYFDFQQTDAYTQYFDLVQNYKTMKQGPEFYQLKFSCGDIGAIYYQHIESKLGNWFTKKSKKEEVHGVFRAISEVDDDMISFTHDFIIAELDGLIQKSEPLVTSRDFNSCEVLRLQVKAELRPVTERLERFCGELASLVIRFAQIAHVPITLS